MRMYLSVRFDRPMDGYAQIPSPGGYEVRTNDGKTYGFDFNESEGWIDNDDPCTVCWRLRDEDTLSFPEIEELRRKLPSIVEITDCHLDMEGMETDDVPVAMELRELIIEGVVSEDCDLASTESVTVKIIGHENGRPHLAVFELSQDMLKRYVF